MMWAVDPPWWFHFLRASSRSQIEKLWGYYKVKGWLTLNMMTIPSWHFHFLKRLIPHSSWGQRCLLIFVQISFSLLVRQRIYTANMQCGLTRCTKFSPLGSHMLYIWVHIQSIWLSNICTCIKSYHNSQKCASPHIFFVSFYFVLQMSSEVWPCSQPVGVADVFNGTWFVSWWWDKHGEEIKTPGFLLQSLAFILLPLAVDMQGQHSRLT